MDEQKTYCTVQDHIDLAKYNIDTCPRCGGSTQKDFEIDMEHFEKTIEEGVSANDGLDLLNKLIQPKKENNHALPKMS